MQVGTSCTSTVSRGTDYTFTWLRRVEWSSSLFAVRAGVLWRCRHPGISPLSRYGIQLSLVLPSVLPAKSLQTSCGLHRFEPVVGAVSPPSWAMLLTRQGISLGPYPRVCAEMHIALWAKQRVPFTLLLHVAMQTGLYLHRRSAFVRCLACSL